MTPLEFEGMAALCEVLEGKEFPPSDLDEGSHFIVREMLAYIPWLPRTDPKVVRGLCVLLMELHTRPDGPALAMVNASLRAVERKCGPAAIIL